MRMNYLPSNAVWGSGIAIADGEYDVSPGMIGCDLFDNFKTYISTLEKLNQYLEFHTIYMNQSNHINTQTLNIKVVHT